MNKGVPQPFLGIHFVSCHVYGRIYKNKQGTHYAGSCPKCAKPISLKIGKEGTSNRFFKVVCGN